MECVICLGLFVWVLLLLLLGFVVGMVVVGCVFDFFVLMVEVVFGLGVVVVFILVVWVLVVGFVIVVEVMVEDVEGLLVVVGD